MLLEHRERGKEHLAGRIELDQSVDVELAGFIGHGAEAGLVGPGAGGDDGDELAAGLGARVAAAANDLLVEGAFGKWIAVEVAVIAPGIGE